MSTGKIDQGQFQVTLVAYGEHRRAKDTAIDAQLILSTDPVGVGGYQCDLGRSVAQHRTRRQLGHGRGLAHTCRPYQGIDPTLFDDIVLRPGDAQIVADGGFHPFQGAIQVRFFVRQAVQQLPCKGAGKTGGEQAFHGLGAQRIAPRQVIPGEPGELPLHQPAQHADFPRQFVHLGLRFRFRGLRYIDTRVLRAECRVLRRRAGRWTALRLPCRGGPK